MSSLFEMPPGGSGWRLLCGHAFHGKYPDTFQIPTEEEIAALRPGDEVKVMVQVHSVGYVERVWVQIKTIDGDAFTGVLNSCLNRGGDPDLSIGLGLPIAFEARHIIWTPAE